MDFSSLIALPVSLGFWQFFPGASIGLTVIGGAVIDETEVLAIYLRKLGTTMGDIRIIINVVMFSVAAYFYQLRLHFIK